ncbi:MAG: hypothetical protein Q9175_006739 [Cornicularia normoerica]
MDPTVAGSSQANMLTPGTLPADDISPAVGRFKEEPKVSFKVAYDLGQGDKAPPIRVIIPKDESYDKFFGRLHNVFYGDSFERSLRQWEYILVHSKYQKDDPLPLVGSNTYYAMVSELLRPRSPWKHAVVRRSHSENPIIRAIAEGTYNPIPASPILDASQPGISIVDHPPVADASPPNVSNADTPMPDAPTGQATPELLTPTPPLRACVLTSASTTLPSPTPSPGPSSKAITRELSTPSIRDTSTRGRRLLQLSSSLAPTPTARDPMQPYLPLISSPLAHATSEGGRRSIQLSSPVAPVTSTPRPSQLSLLLAPAVSTQSLQIDGTAPLTTSAIAQRPAILLSSTSSPAASAPSSSTQISPPLVPVAGVQREPIQLSSPSMEANLPIIPTACAQAPPAILQILSGQSSPQDSETIVDLREVCLCDQTEA